MRNGELFGALRERRFRVLWLGQAISTLGDGLVPVALAFAVVQTLAVRNLRRLDEPEEPEEVLARFPGEPAEAFHVG